MRLLLTIWALLVVFGLTNCSDSHALTLEEIRIESGQQWDSFPTLRDQAKQWVCLRIDCPEHITIDKVDIQGSKFAAAHMSLHYSFN